MAQIMKQTIKLDQVRYRLRTAAAMLTKPRESSARIRARWERQRERGLQPQRMFAMNDWHDALHELLDKPVPCEEDSDFGEVWAGIVHRLQVGPLPVGRGHDADIAFARVVYESTRHLRPEVVIETGVARGITSAVILGAMERNGIGHLYSIDLPPIIPEWHDQSGAAVGPELQDRWTFIRGSSRHHLPRLLREQSPISLACCDSSHTQLNMAFEFAAVWPRIGPGGLLLADDVHMNDAWLSFIERCGVEQWLVGRDAIKSGQFAVARKALG